MNYNAFQTYLEIFRLDEVKVIGKDVMLDDVCIHIVGMGLRKECHNKGAFLYILEEQPLQEKYYDLLENPEKLKEIYESGAKKAQKKANKIVNEVYQKVGLIINS